MALLKPMIFFCLLFLLACKGATQNVVSKEKVVINNYLQLENIPYLDVQKEMIYVPPNNQWTYSHHASITHFKNLFIATWSNGHKKEDHPGQRVLYATSKDFFHWTKPKVLAVPDTGVGGMPNVLTAAGFHQFSDTLVSYYVEEDKPIRNTHLWAKTTVDGIHWSDTIDMKIPVNANLGPAAIASGRLIICGHYTFPYTDDSTGLSGWKMSGFFPDSTMDAGYNPSAFYRAARKMGLPRMCEPDFFQTNDGVIHAMFRNLGGSRIYFLWETESKDNGEHWSRPVKTSFSNDESKFNFGSLPDGRFYYVGNADTVGSRIPLVLSISADGRHFNDTYIIADEIYNRKYGNRHVGQYGYPTTIIYKDKMYVIISREKEAIEVIRFKWENL